MKINKEKYTIEDELHETNRILRLLLKEFEDFKFQLEDGAYNKKWGLENDKMF